MRDIALIEKARESALQGEVLDRESIIALLNMDPDSAVVEKLGETARSVAAEITGNRGGVWASIGVDYKMCPMNCHFCAFGERWGIVSGESEWSTNDVVNYTRNFVSEGARWVTLRTTQFYGIERLAGLARNVRDAVPGNYELVANTGEFDRAKADLLLEAGFQVVYHTLRLREGIDTRFTAEKRLATLDAVKRSRMKLAFLVEPIGVEHSSGELADVFLTGLKYGAALSGAMARVPVPGTPLYGFPAVSERRLAQVVAVTRLAAGCRTPDICVHPPSQLAVEWGANVVVVETGAVPRDTGHLCSEWHGFDMKIANDMFKRAGYRI